MAHQYVTLPSRGILALGGPDRSAFLQGLVSNDVTLAGPSRAIYTAFLTPQGKYLHDFFVIELAETLLLDCEADRLADLQRRLKMYKLRSKITLENWTERYSVSVLPGGDAVTALGLATEPGVATPLGEGVAFVDPRLPDLGARAVLPRGSEATVLEAAGFQPGDPAAYEALRLELGVPDGSRDLVIEKAILLENNLDELHAISWQKGCYLGQELTARTRYRGLVRKRLFPVVVEGPLPAPGTPVMLGDKEAGEMRSGAGQRALALLRLEDIARAETEAIPLRAGEARIIPIKPAWVAF